MSLVFTECPFLAQIPGQGSSFHLTVTPLGPRPGSAPGFPAPWSGPVRSHTCPAGRPSAASLTIALGFGVGEGDRPQKVPPSSRSVEAHTQQAATAGAGRRRLADRCSGAAAARPLPPRSARGGHWGPSPRRPSLFGRGLADGECAGPPSDTCPGTLPPKGTRTSALCVALDLTSAAWLSARLAVADLRVLRDSVSLQGSPAWGRRVSGFHLPGRCGKRATEEPAFRVPQRRGRGPRVGEEVLGGPAPCEDTRGSAAGDRGVPGQEVPGRAEACVCLVNIC